MKKKPLDHNKKNRCYFCNRPYGGIQLLVDTEEGVGVVCEGCGEVEDGVGEGGE